MAQSTRWVFTLNNYTDADETTIQAWNVSYLVYGREVGISGTPHLQGFVTFGGKAKRLSALKKLHPKAHWEVAKGTSLQASDYCKKDGDYFEFGTPPSQGKRTDLELVCEKLKSGKKLPDLAYDHPTTFVKYYRGLRELALTLQEPYEHCDVRGIWIYGPPGVGKSRYARSEWPQFYSKPQNKWFDGYNGETAILLDDFDKQGTCLGHHLKIWTDRYSCTGETKGGTIHLRHSTFIITSNYSIEDLWPEDEELIKALKRRFKCIHMDSVSNLTYS